MLKKLSTSLVSIAIMCATATTVIGDQKGTCPTTCPAGETGQCPLPVGGMMPSIDLSSSGFGLVYGAPEHGAPKYGAPKYGAPKYGAPEAGFGDDCLDQGCYELRQFVLPGTDVIALFEKSVGSSDMLDFFDASTVQGKRAMFPTPHGNLEMALIADGIPAGRVYDVLETAEGMDRAFAVLDRIRDSVVWAGKRNISSLIADGTVQSALIPGNYVKRVKGKKKCDPPTNPVGSEAEAFWNYRGGELDERFQAWLAK